MQNTPQSCPAVLVWFRRDLRLADHAALHNALRMGRKVACAFIYDSEILAPLARADRRVEFIHACVAELDAALRELGGQLIVRHGPGADTIVALAGELGVDAVLCNHDYEPQAIARDAGVTRTLAASGRRLFTFKDQVVFERDEVLTLAGQPFSVYTPYKNAWLKRLATCPEALAVRATDPAPGQLWAPEAARPLPSLQQIGFVATNLRQLAIPIGMSGAHQLFEEFIGRMSAYAHARDYPARKGPSYLSLHLRFGTISIRHLVRTARQLIDSGAGGEGAPVWLAELIWRDFYAMILYQHPHVAQQAFKPACDAIVWDSGPDADAAFDAWCDGRTGYPLVDAAMAQLNQTGYMHNRLRMVTASFLVKDLGIDWRRGEAYFARELNDFDLASNNGGWQWAASTGCDAQPWFRIFNPITQSQKFDADGRFIRRYLPQLAGLDQRDIHAPWLAAPIVLAQHGVRLGVNYPEPIVQHDQARALTLARYGILKSA